MGFMILNRQNFLSVYLMLRDRGWDAPYAYQKLLDIFGPAQMGHYEFLFSNYVPVASELANGGMVEQRVLPTLRLAELEEMAVRTALKKADWIQKKAANLLGISCRALNYKVGQHGIKHPQWRKNKEVNGEENGQDSSFDK